VNLCAGRASVGAGERLGQAERNEHGYLEIAETNYLLTPTIVKETAEDELV
jgi:hypothetical protein